MADWSNTAPDLDSDYASQVLPDLRNRDIDAYSLAESPTNPPTGAIRYNRSANKFQEWNGASWVDKVLSVAGGGTAVTSYPALISALGLGSMAFQNSNAVVITGGSISGLASLGVSGNLTVGGSITAGSGTVTIVDGTGKIPELSATYFASLVAHGQWQYDGNAPQLKFTNATSNWLELGAGSAIPAVSVRSVGTKLILRNALGVSAVDDGLGIETNAMWFSVATTASKFNFYGGVTKLLAIEFALSPALELSPGVDALGSRYVANLVSTANSPLSLMSGEPGVSVNNIVLGNNYTALSGAASGRINTSIGGSFVRFGNNGVIEFIGISNTGVLSSQGFFDGLGNFSISTNLFVSGRGFFNDGTAALPTIGFSNFTSGFYRNFGNTIGVSLNAVSRFLFGDTVANTGDSTFRIKSGNQSPLMIIGNNTSLTEAGGIRLTDKNGTEYGLWVDAAGKLRISAGAGPGTLGFTDTSGTVVGTQT